MPDLGIRRWWALGAVCLAVLAVGVDGTVLSVALPTPSGTLKAGESDLQWFSSGYFLVLAAAMLPAGLLGGSHPRRAPDRPDPGRSAAHPLLVRLGVPDQRAGRRGAPERLRWRRRRSPDPLGCIADVRAHGLRAWHGHGPGCVGRHRPGRRCPHPALPAAANAPADPGSPAPTSGARFSKPPS
jgi:hypothetical protein